VKHLILLMTSMLFNVFTVVGQKWFWERGRIKDYLLFMPQFTIVAFQSDAVFPADANLCVT